MQSESDAARVPWARMRACAVAMLNAVCCARARASTHLAQRTQEELIAEEAACADASHLDQLSTI